MVDAQVANGEILTRVCLVPRPQFILGVADAFRVTVVSDTSPKCIDKEDLGRHRTGTRQEPGKGRSLTYPSSHGRTKFSYTSYET